MSKATIFGRGPENRRDASELWQARQKQQPQLIEVDPMKVKFNPLNPRKHGGTEYFRLKASMQQIGVVQMPTVRQLAGGFYECVDGEGRVKAAQETGLTKIWVVCLGIVSDMDALVMLQAANIVREFSYLAGCKGLANLHRRGQTIESIAKSLGASFSTVQVDIAVGYFPEQTVALIQNDLLQSGERGGQSKLSKKIPQSESGEENRREKRSLLWSPQTFATLLPLRVQVKSVHGNEKGVPATLDGAYDYAEVHRAVEKIVQDDISTHEQLQAYIEQRRRELFEERFDKTLQQRLLSEQHEAEQALAEAHAQDLQLVQSETAQHYETHIQQLQRQLTELGTRHQEMVKEVARRPELIAKLEAELQQKCQEVQEERSHLQALQDRIYKEAHDLRQQLEQNLKAEAEATLQVRRSALENELKQTRTDLEAYYAKKDQQRQLRAEKTVQQAIAHGTELLSQSQQWLLLLITPNMLQGLSWLAEPEMVSLLAQIRTVRNTLEKAEEAMLHVVSQDGEVSYGHHDS